MKKVLDLYGRIAYLNGKLKNQNNKIRNNNKIKMLFVKNEKYSC